MYFILFHSCHKYILESDMICLESEQLGQALIISRPNVFNATNFSKKRGNFLNSKCFILEREQYNLMLFSDDKLYLSVGEVGLPGLLSVYELYQHLLFCSLIIFMPQYLSWQNEKPKQRNIVMRCKTWISFGSGQTFCCPFLRKTLYKFQETCLFSLFLQNILLCFFLVHCMSFWCLIGD